MLIERWLWGGRSLSARIARVALLPLSLLYRGVSAIRAGAYHQRLLKSSSIGIPTISIGNLSVGGTGKTPLAAWAAQYYKSRGLLPAIVLRGYGGDEAAVHRKLVEDALVIENPDRVAGAFEAVRRGADVVVLDDAYQRLDIGRDLNIAVVSAESAKRPQWVIPAGPWREGWRALRRADLVVVSRKSSGLREAEIVAARAERMVGRGPVAIVSLCISGFRGFRGGQSIDASTLNGARIVVAAGIADPDSMAEQCRAMGASVQLIPWRDHHPPSERDVGHLARLARHADRVVVTEKDAVKLRCRWPANAGDLIVAELTPTWDRGGNLVRRALDEVLTGRHAAQGAA